MSRQLSNQLLSQLFAQESDDPFLMLIKLSHPSFDDIFFVNNTEDIVSNGITYEAFPVMVTPAADDGESIREVQIEFDNASLELVEEIRTITDYIDVEIDMVLSANPDQIEITLGELKIKNIMYDGSSIKARLFMDDFLNTELSSEKYAPTNFPGMFA